jgi:hypothetical protein
MPFGLQCTFCAMSKVFRRLGRHWSSILPTWLPQCRPAKVRHWASSRQGLWCEPEMLGSSDPKAPSGSFGKSFSEIILAHGAWLPSRLQLSLRLVGAGADGGRPGLAQGRGSQWVANAAAVFQSQSVPRHHVSAVAAAGLADTITVGSKDAATKSILKTNLSRNLKPYEALR